MVYLYIALSFIYGAMIGSFTNVLIFRLPEKRTVNGRSGCMHCGHQLSWKNLFPIVSFLWQRGRCQYCQERVSIQYPLVEFMVAALFAIAFWHVTPVDLFSSLVALRIFIVIPILVTIFVIDLKHYLILDKLVFPSIGIFLIFNFVLDMIAGWSVISLSSFTGGGIIAAVAAFSIFWIIWFISKGKWMGYGDVKFVFLMGLILGWPLIWFGLYAAFILGAIIGVTLIFSGKKQLSSRIPFGTFLAVGTLISLFFSKQLFDLWHWFSFPF